MLLLRDVHHVTPWGECRAAFVTSDGAEIDTVDLTVERDILDVLLDPDPDALCAITVRGVRYDAMSLLVWAGGVSALGFLLLSLAFDPPGAQRAWTNASLTGWATVAYLAWGANLLGYWLWTRLLSRHPASRVSPLTLGMPLIGIAAGILLLGEEVTAWQWAGAALVMSALTFVMRGGPAAR